MESIRPHQRHHYRVPLAMQYPVMFSDAETVAEGTVMNLTVFGCAIECAKVGIPFIPVQALRLK